MSSEANYWERFQEQRIRRRIFLRSAGVTAVGGAAVALVGCGGGDSSSSGTQAPSTAKSGATTAASATTATRAKPAGNANVSVATLQEQSTSPFFQTGGLSTPIFLHAFEGFYRIGADGRPAPALATAFEQADAQTITFKLRQGAKFWDGSPVTADDIKWSFDAYTSQNPPAAPSVVLKKAVDSVTAPDPATIVVKFTRPIPFQMEELGVTGVPRGWPVASRAYYEKVGADTFKQTPMCTGPYQVTKNSVGQFVELQANENYYDPARIPHVKTIRLNIVPEQQTRLAQIKTGEADVIEGIVGPAADSLKNESSVKIVKTANTALLTVRFFDLWDANTNSVQKDPRFREALNIAVNQDQVAKSLLKMGNPSPGVLIFPNSSGFDAGTLKPRAQDVARAKSLISQAGATGSNFTLGAYTSSSYPLIPEIMQAYSGFWKEIGVNTKIETKESGTYFTEFQAKTPRGLGPISFPNFSSGALLLVGYYKTGAAYSTTDYIPDLQDVITKLSAEFDPNKQNELVKQGLKIVYDGFYMIPSPFVDSLWATGSKIKGWDRIAGVPYVNGLETLTLSS